MRTKASPVFPLFRSRLQGELLAVVLLNPDEARSVTELARVLGADDATVQREVARLERAGILTSRRVGKARVVGAAVESAVFEPLARIVLHAFGPPFVIAQEFEGIAGAEDVYIFGSWAARFHGEGDRAPGDIDVMVVGTPDRDLLYDAATSAERRLGRSVNVSLRSRAAWELGSDALVKQVRRAPLVQVIGGGR